MLSTFPFHVFRTEKARVFFKRTTALPSASRSLPVSPAYSIHLCQTEHSLECCNLTMLRPRILFTFEYSCSIDRHASHAMLTLIMRSRFSTRRTTPFRLWPCTASSLHLAHPEADRPSRMRWMTVRALRRIRRDSDAHCTQRARALAVATCRNRAAHRRMRSFEAAAREAEALHALREQQAARCCIRTTASRIRRRSARLSRQLDAHRPRARAAPSCRARCRALRTTPRRRAARRAFLPQLLRAIAKARPPRLSRPSL